MAADNW